MKTTFLTSYVRMNLIKHKFSTPQQASLLQRHSIIFRELKPLLCRDACFLQVGRFAVAVHRTGSEQREPAIAARGGAGSWLRGRCGGSREPGRGRRCQRFVTPTPNDSVTVTVKAHLRLIHTKRHNVTLTGGTFDLFDGNCDRQNGLHTHQRSVWRWRWRNEVAQCEQGFTSSDSDASATWLRNQFHAF